jgi:hypothetical protein
MEGDEAFGFAVEEVAAQLRQLLAGLGKAAVLHFCDARGWAPSGGGSGGGVGAP